MDTFTRIIQGLWLLFLDGVREFASWVPRAIFFFTLGTATMALIGWLFSIFWALGLLSCLWLLPQGIIFYMMMFARD